MLVGLVGLVACGNSSVVSWRGLELSLPRGWVVIQELEGSLYVADGRGGGPGDPGDLDVGVQLSHEPETRADDWRELVDELGATMDRDEATTVGGMPATLLQYTVAGGGDVAPTRERVVLVPSRQLVVLAQAVPVRGQTDAPEVFDDHLAAIQQLIDSIEFGAPVEHS